MIVKIVSLILSVFVLTGCDGFRYIEPTQPEKIKGMWLSYHDLAKPLKCEDEKEFTSQIETIFDNCKSLGVNTLFLHLRLFGDSIYPSELFPKSKYVKGDYDPLSIMVKVAKSKNLSLHGWINPMRCMTVEEIASVPENYAVRRWYDEKSDCVLVHDGRIYLNPEKEEVRRLIAGGVREILNNYDVDGIHIDDYFYPANLPFEKDNSNGDKRRENTDKMVKELYQVTKENGSVFSISPTGNMNYNYSVIYSDSQKWCSQSGYCDYIIPQIYYGFENEALSFEEALENWCSVSKVKVLVGLAAYKVGNLDKYAGKGQNEWIEDKDILSKQTEKVKEYPQACGVVYFRYGSFFE